MDINYTLIRSDRKSISIRIGDNGDLTVRAPRRISRSDIDKAVYKHKEWIESHRTAVIERSIANSSISAIDEAALRLAAKKYLFERTQYFADLTGLHPLNVKIGGAKKRFGSCSSGGNISYSYLLMLYPPKAIDYVVLHEICHLKFMNHSENFYELVSRYMPDWKERKALLKFEMRRSTAEIIDSL